MNKMLTIKEATVTFGMSDYAIRQGIRSNRLPAVQLGGSSKGKYLIDPVAFETALRNLCMRNTESPIDNKYGMKKIAE